MKLSLTPEEFVELCRLLFPLEPIKKGPTRRFDPIGTGISWEAVKPRAKKRTRRKTKARRR